MFKGKKVLVTAGPTREAIDPVRYISNHSSGKMGYALAEAFHAEGAEVTLVSGPVHIETSLPASAIINVISAEEMLMACQPHFPELDIVIFCAAVADYRVETIAASKLKKKDSALTLRLVPNADIALAFAAVKKQNQLSVGFALETDDLIENGKKKLERKQLDLIVLNSPDNSGSGFGHDTNKIAILDADGRLTHYSLKSKKEVANDIISYLSNICAQRSLEVSAV